VGNVPLPLISRRRLRKVLLALAPLPIVAASMALANWARTDQMSGATRNTFQNLSGVDPVERPVDEVEDLGPMEASCQETLDRLSSRLCSDCEFVLRPPLVLGGNLTQSELIARYQATIQPAFRAMQATYFDASPTSPITILLFSDARSYREFSKRLLGHRHLSLYGYYRPSAGMVVVNLGAGAGTIVHELTHALMEYDFPDVPVWFNEGLASLHEECRWIHRDGKGVLEGLPNWRYRILHQAIQTDELTSISDLFGTQQVRGPDEAINYAYARYFCMFLQERGLLETFYREFREHVAEDPTGVNTLQRLISVESWQTLDADFREWAVGLAK